MKRPDPHMRRWIRQHPPHMRKAHHNSQSLSLPLNQHLMCKWMHQHSHPQPSAPSPPIVQQSPTHEQSVQQAAEIAHASRSQPTSSETPHRETQPAAAQSQDQAAARAASLQRHSESLQHLSAHYVDQKIQALYQRYNPKSFQELAHIFKKYDTDQLRTALLAAHLRKYEPETTIGALTAQAEEFDCALLASLSLIFKSLSPQACKIQDRVQFSLITAYILNYFF